MDSLRMDRYVSGIVGLGNRRYEPATIQRATARN